MARRARLSTEEAKVSVNVRSSLLPGEGLFEPSPEELLPDLPPRAEVAVLARALYREGYEEHIAGHISYKQPDGTLLVNPYHLRWDELRASHVCRIDLDGNVLDGSWMVSGAIQLHLALHRARPDVTVAVHNHPRWGTIWASLLRVPPVHDQTSALVDNDIVLHDDYSRPVGDPDEARAAIAALGDAKAALLAHHGVLVVADDVAQAYARCMSLEWRCRIAWHVEAAGGAAPMPAEASQRLARGIDRRGYPGLFEAMARQEIQLDPRVVD
jgi:ribulose-5-phosphate 4-epimerase/fuculose-1-phosphate aldolase